MSKRQVVKAMYAASECLRRTREGKHLPTQELRLIAAVMGDDAQRLVSMNQSAFLCPDGEQRDLAIDFLAEFIDDCRVMLATSGKAESHG